MWSIDWSVVGQVAAALLILAGLAAYTLCRMSGIVSERQRRQRRLGEYVERDR